MVLLDRLRSQFTSWWHSLPLPYLPDASLTFQSWREFHPLSQQWQTVPTDWNLSRAAESGAAKQLRNNNISIVSWNVDAFSALPSHRLAAILSRIGTLNPDVVFFQELSRPALTSLLADSYIRDRWYSSESDDTSWEGQPFATLTLLSKACFNGTNASIGPLWRVAFPSRYGRDALCCDVFITHNRKIARVRLINVHLDSLAIRPSRRPRQLQIAASLLRCTGRGLVAGDFNPVLPEDWKLVQDNQLLDAWLQLHADEPGFTWGIDGTAPFPPNRMDKIATMGLIPRNMETIHPGFEDPATHDSNVENNAQNTEQILHSLPWSDHSGLTASFDLDSQ